MKHIAAFFFVCGLAVLAVYVQPGGEPMEAQAALLTSHALETICTSPECQDGWDTAYISAISDESECRSISDELEEIRGCKAFVQDSLQDRLQKAVGEGL